MSSESSHSDPFSGAIFPSRLEWLCQPEQIEHTLALLFALNPWKKAYQHLLYADRQGLQDVQTQILAYACRVGRIQAVAYLDGSAHFPATLLLESAAENASSGILAHLRCLGNPDLWPPALPQGDQLYQRFLRPLFHWMTGKDFPLVADAANALEREALSAYLHGQLQEMVASAQRTRQPLSQSRLASLCIAPIDLLPIRDNRVYFLDSYESWDALDRSDRRKLDPEGASAVAVAYHSPTADFVFHLPWRSAETFAPFERLRALQKTPGSSQERGVYQGKPIEAQTSQKHSAKEILQDLGVVIVRVCPHELADKASYLARPAMRDLLWPSREDDSAWDDDPWDRLCLPPDER